MLFAADFALATGGIASSYFMKQDGFKGKACKIWLREADSDQRVKDHNRNGNISNENAYHYGNLVVPRFQNLELSGFEIMLVKRKSV